MENLDKLISALYHTKSDNREKMLTDLVLTVLYSSNQPLTIESIIRFVKEFFHLEPLKYEVENCLLSLVREDQIKQRGAEYFLTEDTQSQIHSSLIRGKDNLNKRFEAFRQNITEMFGHVAEVEEIQLLWKVYNEYLLECFMFFGRKAINIFLPYKQDDLPQNDLVLEKALEKLASDNLKIIFKKLVVEYPQRLTEAELRHLNGLAFRAEKFYSLGVEKEEYDKISNLQIRNLVVLTDTNILYADLNLHVHQEKSAITEIIRMAKDKTIDFKIVYIPKTYKELQKARKPLESLISREKFKQSQIKAMLASGTLDDLATNYYENLLQNSEYPHPADSITYASDILRQHGITLYNHRFEKLEDDKRYLNSQIAEYYDYQRFYNNLYEEEGLSVRLNKDDFKIEHDVFLREVIKILKEKFSKDILKFICLTTDRSLLHFDQYMLRKENIGVRNAITPNFMMPSVFIKKIRPFIPLITNNYRKAFVSSLTVPAFHKESGDERERTIMTQKSMTYFKSLGIEDEEVICGIIKRELFLEEFSRQEEHSTGEEFIKSEIAKAIESLRSQKRELEKEIEENEKNLASQKELNEKIVDKERKEAERLKAEKEKSEQEKQTVIDDLVAKIRERELVEERLQKLNKEQEKFSIENTIELKSVILDEVNQSIITLENSQKPLLDIVDSRHRKFIWQLSIIPIAYFIIIWLLINRFSWNVMEPYTYLSSLLGVICTYLFFAITGKSFNPSEYFNNKKSKLAIHVYAEFNFNNEYLEAQRKRKSELELEISDLSKSTE